MSETLQQTPEQAVETPQVSLERPAAAEFNPADQAQEVERAQAAVALEAGRSEQPTVPQLAAVDDRPRFIDNAVKSLRLRQNLTEVQKRLTPTDKALSKVVHQPLVSLVSNKAAQTVTRPSGLLGGGVAAFIGSLIYVYLAHHIGFSYNYLLFVMFFGGGFILGVGGEYAAYWLRRATSPKPSA